MIEKDDFDWRTEAGMIVTPYYKKRFSFLPVRCKDNTMIWLKPYYKKYKVWGNSPWQPLADAYDSKVFVESVTESEFIMRKLSGTL